MRAGVWAETGGGVQTADEAVRKVAGFQSFDSGSNGLNDLLGGGYRAGTIAEIYGRSNTGKTQLAMQVCIIAASKGTRCLFIDTEGSFRPERLEEIAEARGIDSHGALERVIYIRSDSFSEQAETIRQMEQRPATRDCRLVVVDTLTRNFSVELPGRGNISNRQGALNVHISEMARDAYLNGRAYLLLNRVTFGPGHDVGIGGRTVEQLVRSSIRLDREGGKVRATLVPAGGSRLLEIGKPGID